MQNYGTISDFATMPPFHNYATFYGKFWVKNIFSRMQISGMEKTYPEKCFFDIKLHFFTKKKLFFYKIFVIFEFLSNSEAWLQNLRLVHDFSEISGRFDTYIGPGSAFVLKWEI